MLSLLDVIFTLWRIISRHPKSHVAQLLLICALSRIYALSVAINLGLLDLRRLFIDPNYTLPLSRVLAPELHGFRGVLWMVNAWQVPYLLVSCAWEYRHHDDDVVFLLGDLAGNWRLVIGFVCKYSIAGSIMTVIAHILIVLGVAENIRYGAEVLLILVLWTWILTVVVIWPLVKSIMLSRDVELPWTGKWTVGILAAAMPILLEDIPPDSDCPICYQSLGELFDEAQDVAIIPQCEHVFCHACISKWICNGHGSCPLCRYDFIEDLIDICEDDKTWDFQHPGTVTGYPTAPALSMSVSLEALRNRLVALFGLVMTSPYRVVTRCLATFLYGIKTLFDPLVTLSYQLVALFHRITAFVDSLTALWDETAPAPQEPIVLTDEQHFDNIFFDRQHRYHVPSESHEGRHGRIEELLTTMEQRSAARMDKLARQDRLLQSLEQRMLSLDRRIGGTTDRGALRGSAHRPGF
ncbi:uncharacterized protein B0H18DRAFT_686349 [Fomitopsis serialis]|uniref:uncharacterized protein n=1 Tax=Fomitopsis serialis TaxID=139415 RepID=UPI00200741BD|nr:uncharacterized protein B0H18DRAFT_686349 [Neoantrodia serialis]KAH9917810.1 hypothetical protein B0H18DRAFT_686349 [Neoantrodia serialis]